MDKKLYKSQGDRKLCGVCGGLGEFFGIDASLIRLASCSACWAAAACWPISSPPSSFLTSRWNTCKQKSKGEGERRRRLKRNACRPEKGAFYAYCRNCDRSDRRFTAADSH